MPKWLPFLGIGIVAMMTLACAGGNVAFQQGRKAEERKDWDTALVDYEKAVQAEPDNAQFLLHQKLARTYASLFNMEEGKRLLSEGRKDEAMGEFQKAVSIDPSNIAAGQQLDQLLAEAALAKKERAEKLEKAIKASEQQAPSGVIKLQPLPTTPLAHFHITAESKLVFQTLAKLANLNVAFSSDFRPGTLSLDLSNVTVEEALKTALLETRSFYKVVTPNTILIVPDNPANERVYQTKIVKTIYLTNPLSQTARSAIVNAVKQLLQLQYVIDNPDSNAIIIRDTPENVAEAVQLIHDLDRGKAEILINVTVLEADADRVRDLGLQQVPTSPLTGANVAGLAFTATTMATTVINGTSQTATVPGLPLNRLPKISTRDFSIVVPGAVANALLTDSHTRILQNPQIRVTDGETAKLKIGSKIPYATGSFLPSFGGGLNGTNPTTGTTGFGLLSSTMFQFEDVGVNLDLTPHLMLNGEVEINSKIDISSVGQTFNIGGLNEPSFGQRSIDHDIRLKEGEVNLLGGLIESTNTTQTTGVPGLSQIPGLKYFFSSTHRERVDTEVLIMLTPYVIRLPEPAAEGETAIAAQGGGGAVPPTPRPLLGPFRRPPRP